jgi:ribosomal protein L23
MISVKYPILTEKSAVGMNSGLYVFAVTDNANKVTIAKELKDLYNVEAISVRIVNLPAKEVSFKRVKGTRSIRRKAYVQLKEKQQIPGFEALKEDMKKQSAEAQKPTDDDKKAKKVEQKVKKPVDDDEDED